MYYINLTQSSKVLRSNIDDFVREISKHFREAIDNYVNKQRLEEEIRLIVVGIDKFMSVTEWKFLKIKI